MSRTNNISSDQLERYSEAFYSDRANIIAANAVTKNGFLDAAVDYKGLRKLPHSFSAELQQSAVTAQKKSGRCWIFAALNVLRYEVMHKWNLGNFEFSQNYIYFYDKLEKANFFLENVIKTADEAIDSRLYAHLIKWPLNDGGQWDMFVNIVEKYGVVPKDAYPDTAVSEDTMSFTAYLTAKLWEYGEELRRAAQAGAGIEELRQKKSEQLKSVYRILSIGLGEPPQTFDYTVKSRTRDLQQEFHITPKAFYEKYVGIDLSQYISIINAPTADKPYEHTFSPAFLGNVVGGRPVIYLNLPIETVKKAAIAQLTDGHPVWFGADCGRFALRKEGVFDQDTLRVEDLFGIHFEFDKAQRLDYCDSTMNHAMVFQGVNLDENGNPNRWRIENSWGAQVGHGGYFVASDGWFDDYVYQVVIHKKYLDDHVLRVLEQEPIELAPWDPMGSLAD